MTTEARKQLREEVARALYEAEGGIRWGAMEESDKNDFRNVADAAIAVVGERMAKVADELGCECEGCGHLCGNPETDMAIIKKAGGVSCCPERKMRPLGDAIRSLTQKEK